MLWAFHLAKVPFEAIVIDYKSANKHDIVTLYEFANLHGIAITRRVFDAKKFILSAELIDYAKKYDCSSPQILTYIKMVEGIPGMSVMSGNFLSRITCSLNWTLLALQRYAKESNKLIPFFFCENPNIAYSFFHQPFQPLHDQGYTSKVDAYRPGRFPVIKQDNKFTGFKKIKKSFDKTTVLEEIKFKWRMKPLKRPFDILYRYQLFDHIKEYS